MNKVLSLPPPQHIKLVFRDEVWQRLNEDFEVVANDEPRHLTPDDAAEQLDSCGALLTGWGAREFTREHLEAAPELKIIAHTAGSVKHLFAAATVREVLLPRGITVFSANDAIAINVAEATV